MVKNISLFLVAFLLSQLSFGKSVDEQSAKMIGYNFFKNEGIQIDPSAMSLAYKTTSTIHGELITDFYVFSTGSAGFIIISGDDDVIPVLGYSTESSFRAYNIPEGVNNWLNNYKNQINYVIENKVPVPVQTVAQWKELQQAPDTKRAERTTAVVILPLMHTQWDQTPYYNGLCPFDVPATNALTGCVATAMAQVMKYWNWPKLGIGSNTYSSPYGMLSANFGATTYQWDSMPNMISNKNNFIATLMLHAGISVNMSYGVTGSGAFVNINSSPITNCAEYALKTYFNYNKSTLRGVSRDSYDDSSWVHLIKGEVESGRPVIYTGDGSAGGHCFICDGFTTNDRFHINWGWGSLYNGYYAFNNLAPGSTDFNAGQTIMYGIMPNRPGILGISEAATSNVIIYPNPATDVINIDLHGTKTTKISLADMQGRELKVIVPVNNTTLVSIPVQELSEGMYFVSLQTEQGIETKKIVITK